MPIEEEPGPDDIIAPLIVPPAAGATISRRYVRVDVSAMGDIPLFRVVHLPPSPFCMPAPDGAAWRAEEQHYLTLSAMRQLARQAACHLGFPATCRRGACRRVGLCTGRRHEFDWSFPGPWMVPCASTLRLVDQVRTRVREALDEMARPPDTPDAPPAIPATSDSPTPADDTAPRLRRCRRSGAVGVAQPIGLFAVSHPSAAAGRPRETRRRP